MDKLAPIEFIFGDKPYSVHPDDFNLGPATNGSSLCVGGIGGEYRVSTSRAREVLMSYPLQLTTAMALPSSVTSS